MVLPFVDMDGVLTEFVRPSLRLHGLDHLADDLTYPSEYNYWNLLGMSEKEFWAPIKKRGEAWWAALPGTTWYRELVDMLNQHFPDWEVATKPTRKIQGCLDGKRRWLDDHVGERIVHYSFDKSRLSAPGRLLLDDCPPNIAAWKKYGGDGILVPAPYNELAHLYRDKDAMVNYLQGELLNYVGR